MQANRTLTGFITAMLILAVGQWSQATEAPHRPYVDGEVLVRHRETRAPQRAVHYRAMWRLSSVRTFEKSGIRNVRLPSDMAVSQAVAQRLSCSSAGFGH